MSRSIQAALFVLPLLAGCGSLLPTTSSSNLKPLPPLPPPPEWRMLTEEEGPHPTPLGYLEVQRVSGPEGLQGAVCLVYDREFRILGHVTRKGHALRYRDHSDDIGESLGMGSLPDQLGRILRAKRPLRSFDLQGRPQGLP